MTLFLEQYLDNLQMLPGDLQRKLRLLRELDQRSQKEFETGDTLTNAFVANLSNLSKEERKKCYEDISSHYSKAKALGDEKVQLAMQTYEMVDKHIRRLDAELARFEGELKRNIATSRQIAGAEQQQLSQDGAQLSSAESEEGAETGTTLKSATNAPGRKKRKDDGGDASSKSQKKRKKAEESTVADKIGGGAAAATPGGGDRATTPSTTTLATSGGSDGVGLMRHLANLGADVMDMPIDPNEPTYCICHQVSYGEMIGCDNPDCPIEWFHFNCVGLTTKPKGKWFCPRCSDEKKKTKN